MAKHHREHEEDHSGHEEETSLTQGEESRESDGVAAKKRIRRQKDDRALHRFLLGKVEADPWSHSLHLEATRNPFGDNPHSVQTLELQVPTKSSANDGETVYRRAPCYIDMPFSRELLSDAPMSDLYISKENVKGNFSVIHWGQMKLLMSELEFLTPYFGETGLTVIYVGAAPGLHIPLLNEMFDTFTFELYDPAPFGIKESERIHIFQEEFTSKKALEISIRFEGSKNKLLFISDIRTAPTEEENQLKKEDRDEFYKVSQARITRDMDQQQEWHLIMKPWRSILKFRLPWDTGTTTYLAGKIHFAVWGPIYSHETRLITFEHPQNSETLTYDHRKYMLQLSYFNTVTRTCLYAPDPYHENLEHACHHRCRNEFKIRPSCLTAIDHCYDCTAHLNILTRYVLKKIGKDPDADQITVTDEISQAVHDTVNYLEDQLYQSQFL